MVEEKIIQAEKYAFIEHIWVIQALFTFAISCLEKKCRRQIEVINTLTALCCLQKARRSYRPKTFVSDIKLKWDIKLLSVLDPPGFSNSIPIEYEVTQYIFCLRKKKIPAVIRLKSFHSRGNLKKYFHCKHLWNYSNSKLITCSHSRYNIKLKMHLQNDAALVHKTLI